MAEARGGPWPAPRRSPAPSTHSRGSAPLPRVGGNGCLPAAPRPRNFPTFSTLACSFLSHPLLLYDPVWNHLHRCPLPGALALSRSRPPCWSNCGPPFFSRCGCPRRSCTTLRSFSLPSETELLPRVRHCLPGPTTLPARPAPPPPRALPLWALQALCTTSFFTLTVLALGLSWRRQLSAPFFFPRVGRGGAWASRLGCICWRCCGAAGSPSSFAAPRAPLFHLPLAL